MAEWAFVAVVTVGWLVNWWIDRQHRKEMRRFCEWAERMCEKLEVNDG